MNRLNNTNHYSKSKNPLDIFLLIFTIILILFILEKIFRGYILIKYLQLKKMEFFIIRPILFYIFHYKNIYTIPYSIRNINYYINIFISIFLILICCVIYLFNKKNNFNRILTMKKLKDINYKHFLSLHATKDINIINKNINDNIWSMALTPIDFLKKKNIICTKNNIIDIIKLQVELSNSLGSIWINIYNEPSYIKVLIYIFSVKITKKYKKTNNLLKNISSKFDFKKKDIFINDINKKLYYYHEIITQYSKYHYYTNTVVINMYYYAKKRGIFSSSEFLWLKIIDRNLWYALNSLGRKTPFIEGSIIVSHWNIEFLLKKKVIIPFMEEVIFAIKKNVKERENNEII